MGRSCVVVVVCSYQGVSIVLFNCSYQGTSAVLLLLSFALTNVRALNCYCRLLLPRYDHCLLSIAFTEVQASYCLCLSLSPKYEHCYCRPLLLMYEPCFVVVVYSYQW